MGTATPEVDMESISRNYYNKIFKERAYSSWEYAQIIQRSALCKGDDWKTFLDTSRDNRKQWSESVKEEIHKNIGSICDDDLQNIKESKNGDCAIFTTAVVTGVSPDSFVFMGYGDHVLAYSIIGNEVLIIDSMYKGIIKFSADDSPQWVQSRKLDIKQPEDTKYYPEQEGRMGLIVKRNNNPSTVRIWRVMKDKKTNNAECLHLEPEKCKHEPFEKLSGWKDAIRQSLTHWTMEGHCVILFRTNVEQGPGFDGQIEFLAGQNRIIFKQRKFIARQRLFWKREFEFRKVTEDEFSEEKDVQKRKEKVTQRKFQLKVGFVVFVDDFLDMSETTNRKEQFTSTNDAFFYIIDMMEVFFGSPRAKKETLTDDWGKPYSTAILHSQPTSAIEHAGTLPHQIS